MQNVCKTSSCRSSTGNSNHNQLFRYGNELALVGKLFLHFHWKTSFSHTHTHNIYTEREREQEQEFYQRLKGVASAQQGIASGSFEMRWMSSTCFDWEKTKTTTIKKMLNSILYVLMLKSVRHFNSCLFLKFSFAHLCFSSIHWCWNNSSMNKRDWIAVCHFDKIPMGRIKKWK